MLKKILFALALITMIIMYAFMVNGSLSDSMVRFHIIANSNEEYDQELKLLVRDAVILETKKITGGINDKKDAVSSVMKNKDKLLVVAQKTIQENGYDYPVDIEYGNFFFPKKEYDNIELPSGRYDAVRIKIGKAEGENWWCVMFPPLCVSGDATGRLDEKAMEYLEETLSKDELELVKKGKTIPVVIRFRIVDEIMKLAEHIA